MIKKIFFLTLIIIIITLLLLLVINQNNRKNPLVDKKAEINYALSLFKSDNQYFDYLIESPHLKIYFSSSDKEIARQLIALTENSYSYLIKIYKNSPADKTNIFLFQNFDKLKKLTSVLPFITSSSGFGGFDTFPPLGEGVKIYIPEKDKKIMNEIEIQQTFMLTHEISHRFFYYLYPNIRKPLRPNWLDEGLATYIGLEASQFYKMSYGFDAVVNWGKQKEVFPVKLNSLDKLQEKNETLDLFYGLSASIIYFLCKNYGQDSIGQFLEEYNKTTDLYSSFLKVFKVSIIDFEKEWLNFTQETAHKAKSGTDFYNLYNLDMK